MNVRATYRLQFHKDFPFERAIPLAPYLAKLGISHVYASPILRSRAGSRHGYDVIDHCVIDAELGGEQVFRQLASALREHELGIVLDIVPNHMAVHNENRWWMDVLEHGRESRYADTFDIDWDMHEGKVLAAFLARPYWEALEAGEIKIVRDRAGKYQIAYFDWRFPIRPEDQETAGSLSGERDSLHQLLERQHYRLAWWRIANDEINWRRFFDIPDLIALNQDRDEVFEATHAKIFALYEEGLIDGVRIDHIDGLADPATYCRRLRRRLNELAEREGLGRRPYIVVEKILGAGEEQAADWGIDGTTGYDFMNDVSAVLHNADAAHGLAEFWKRLSSRSMDFDDEERLARGEILSRTFESAWRRTADAFVGVALNSRHGRDISRASLRRAVARILQYLRVYRTHATGVPESPSPGSHFMKAAEHAKQGATGTDQAAIGFLVEAIRGDGHLPTDRRDSVRLFNQLSAPVAAKGVEDTAFYRYGRLLSRNDVGFDPGTLGITSDEFHARVLRRASGFPNAMLATATHDHKRGEDVRARLAVLSEIPDEWRQQVEIWFALNAHLRGPAIEQGEEYQLYQTVVGAWTFGLSADSPAQLSAFCERIVGWRLKSLHEAKLRTSWLDHDKAYEDAHQSFIRAILSPGAGREFLDSTSAFVERIAPGGALNGLAQATLRYTVPGVPDCYQGTEFWDLSLVDPDNRRKVDYAARVSALEHPAEVADLLAGWRDGRLKQALIASLLNLRRENPDLFARGEYRPLHAIGERRDNVLAFMRKWGGQELIVTVPLHGGASCPDVPRLPSTYWGDTALPLPQGDEPSWRHLFDRDFGVSAQAVPCRDLFAHFPIAILIR